MGTEKKEEVGRGIRDEEEKQSLKLHHRVQSEFPTLLIIVHFHIYGLKNENTLDKSRYSSIHTDITDVIVKKVQTSSERLCKPDSSPQVTGTAHPLSLGFSLTSL